MNGIADGAPSGLSFLGQIEIENLLYLQSS